MKRILLAAVMSVALTGTAVAQTCVGNCGTLGADGVVTAPPGGTTYSYVSYPAKAEPMGQRTRPRFSVQRQGIR